MPKDSYPLRLIAFGFGSEGILVRRAQDGEQPRATEQELLAVPSAWFPLGDDTGCYCCGSGNPEATFYCG